jgi:DNA-binding beta-propeller fold protein YncE
MKNNYFPPPPSALGSTWPGLGLALALTLLLAGPSLVTGATVTTLGGGNPNINPKYLGYRDGNTLSQALFHTPAGVALDSTDQYLFVADRDNSVIRYLDLTAGQTWTLALSPTNLINKPVAVAVDGDNFVYVLNRGNGTNGSLITFDYWGDAFVTNAVRLTNAAGMAITNVGAKVYVTDDNTVQLSATSTIQVGVITEFISATSVRVALTANI